LLEAVPRIYQVTPDIPDRRRATKQEQVRPQIWPTASKRVSSPPVGNLPSASDVTDDANHNSKPRSSGCSHTPGGIRSAQAAHSGQAAYWEVVVTVLRIGAWPGLIVAVMLVVVGLVAGGTAGTMVLAVGFLALLGAGIRLISRNDSPPPEGRVPAGQAGV
jgi:hypothetical protein